jgi:ribosome-associated heat shock protein Hsp15
MAPPSFDHPAHYDARAHEQADLLIVGGSLPMDAPVRIDKWLWAARLMKTRALAAEAVKGGRVHVNGNAVKPSRDVRAGDRIEVTAGTVRRVVDVRATAERRGPASEAALLYEETPESVAAREREREARRFAQPPAVARGAGRPTKRDRRRYDRSAGSRRRG